MALTASAPPCIVSVFINDGANVFEDEAPPFEPERCPDIKPLLGGTGAASEEYDWWRVCPGLWVEDGGDDMTMDLGRPLDTFGPGEGDAVLVNGLFRFCPRFEAML